MSAAFVVDDSRVKPVLSSFVRVVSFDVVADVDIPMTSWPKLVVMPFVKVPFDAYMLLAAVVFEACILSAPMPVVRSSTELVFGLTILGSGEASLRERLSS